MDLSEQVAVGKIGSVSVSESGGEAILSVTLSQSAGGGSLAGAARFSLSMQAEVEAKQVIDAGFAVAKAKFASSALVVAAIGEAQALIDAELAKA
jgi:hypothetical protein